MNPFDFQDYSSQRTKRIRITSRFCTAAAQLRGFRLTGTCRQFLQLSDSILDITLSSSCSAGVSHVFSRALVCFLAWYLLACSSRQWHNRRSGRVLWSEASLISWIRHNFFGFLAYHLGFNLMSKDALAARHGFYRGGTYADAHILRDLSRLSLIFQKWKSDSDNNRFLAHQWDRARKLYTPSRQEDEWSWFWIKRQ